MATYKKLDNVITIKQSNSALNEVPLFYNNSALYFGLEDQDGNYEGNLTQTRYNLSADQSGCSAYTKNINQSTTGTALQIVASITKNDSEKQKIITYKYNNIPLFKIIQPGYNYFYFNKVEIKESLINTSVYLIATINAGTPIQSTSILPSMPALNFTHTQTIYFFYSLTTQATFDKYGKFTYISGAGDILGNPQNNEYQQIPQLLGIYDGNTNKITTGYFYNYKTQIQYISIFIRNVDTTIYTSPAAIDFSQSSKYKVE